MSNGMKPCIDERRVCGVVGVVTQNIFNYHEEDQEINL